MDDDGDNSTPECFLDCSEDFCTDGASCYADCTACQVSYVDEVLCGSFSYSYACGEDGSFSYGLLSVFFVALKTNRADLNIKIQSAWFLRVARLASAAAGPAPPVPECDGGDEMYMVRLLDSFGDGYV